MRYFILVFSLVCSSFIHSQVHTDTTGTKIIKNLSWEEIKAKAKSEHKNILIDCGSTWCGPCKYLENVLFPMDTIGKLLNDKFLVVSVQFDSSDKDNAYTKSWYSTANYFKKEFNITNFPTEVVLDENATPITKFCGVDTYNSVANLYEQINSCFQPQFQYFTLKNQLKVEKNLSSKQLKEFAVACSFAGEQQLFIDYRNKYLKSLDKAKFNTKENYEFIVGDLISSKDSLFDFVFNNYKKIDSVVESPIAITRISGIIYYEELKWKRIFKNPSDINPRHYVAISEPNWDDLKQYIDPKYANIIPAIIFSSKYDFYNLEQSSDAYFTLISSVYNPNIPIYRIFTDDICFQIIDKILLTKKEDNYWMNTALKWLNELEATTDTSKINRFKDNVSVMLKSTVTQKSSM